jgi:hypothetical protein
MLSVNDDKKIEQNQRSVIYMNQGESDLIVQSDNKAEDILKTYFYAVK